MMFGSFVMLGLVLIFGFVVVELVIVILVMTRLVVIVLIVLMVMVIVKVCGDIVLLNCYGGCDGGALYGDVCDVGTLALTVTNVSTNSTIICDSHRSLRTSRRLNLKRQIPGFQIDRRSCFL